MLSKIVKLDDYFFNIIMFIRDGTYCILDEIFKEIDQITIAVFIYLSGDSEMYLNKNKSTQDRGGVMEIYKKEKN